jgi:hypothetical protein
LITSSCFGLSNFSSKARFASFFSKQNLKKTDREFRRRAMRGEEKEEESLPSQFFNFFFVICNLLFSCYFSVDVIRGWRAEISFSPLLLSAITFFYQKLTSER